MAAITTGDAKVRAEDDLVRAQDAQTITEEAMPKVEAEVLEVERTSLLLEVGATKDEVSSLQSQAGKDKTTMDEDYQKAMELIFFFFMVMNVVCLNTTSVAINQKF